MAEHIIVTNAEGIASEPVRKALKEAQRAGGRPTLFVPGLPQQDEAQRVFAQESPDFFGVDVTSMSSWLEERWEAWGDGTHLVSPPERTLIFQQLLSGGETASLTPNPGTLRVLGQLACSALPYLPLNSDGNVEGEQAKQANLTSAEIEAIEWVARYSKELCARNLTEGCVAAGTIIQRLLKAQVTLPAVVVSGFATMRRPQRELLVQLAQHSHVWIVFEMGNEVATAQTAQLIEQLKQEAAAADVVCEVEEDHYKPQAVRTTGLTALKNAIFQGRNDLTADGSVELLYPAGSHAEAELIARRIEDLVKQGERQIVVAAPSAERAWRKLAPKLVARGISVEGSISKNLLSCDAGRAFLEFAQKVATLNQLAESWPEPTQTKEGETAIRLGDMSWWPPEELIDFFENDIAQMSVYRAQRLDKRWRGDRLLTPQEVLGTLQKQNSCSPIVAAATRELLKGHIGGAAMKLAEPYLNHTENRVIDDYAIDAEGEQVNLYKRPHDPYADAEAQGVLRGVVNASAVLRSQGLHYDPKNDSADKLCEVVEYLKQPLGETTVSLHPAVEAEGSRGRVLIVSKSEAATMEPASADVLISCAETSTESAVDDGDDVVSSLFERLNIDPVQDPMMSARARFYRMLCVPIHKFICERTQFGADSKQCFPSVMVQELLGAYGMSDEKPKQVKACIDNHILVTELSEYDAARNISAEGKKSEITSHEKIGPTGSISKASRPYISFPSPTKVELYHGKPVLSASQIESYLECPYKWFSMRRLNLTNSDAEFGNMEMGTFVHRVLQVTGERMLTQALVGGGISEEDLKCEPWTEVAGSRVSDPKSLEVAQKLLNEEFDEHLSHQYIVKGKNSRPQAFVPHTEEDQGKLMALRQDLLSALKYQGELFDGFEPRFFEWNFGKEEPVEYASVYMVGTIDRIDVNAHRQALVIDYKHRSANSFFSDYAVFPPKQTKKNGGKKVELEPEGEEDQPFVLPKHIQTLAYAQILRRLTGLKVCGGVYLCTRRDHGLSGAVSEHMADIVYGDHQLSSRSLNRIAVPPGFTGTSSEESGFNALLDTTEDLIAEKIEELLDGNIEANPRDKDACKFCPVLNCEKRQP